MIKNYILLAWRVLGRRKFFTFISLFGISFTLGILMVILSFLQSELGSNAPLTKKEDLALMHHFGLKKPFYDTITIIDTVYENNIAVYDTTFELKEGGSSMSNSGFSPDLIQSYFADIPSADNFTMFNPNSSHDLYVNGVKLTVMTMFADHKYFEVLDHNILEGRVFTKEDVDNVSKVIVISSKTAQEYFGRQKDVVGEEMEINEKLYKVIGLFEHHGKFVPWVSPDALIPYTNEEASAYRTFYFGTYRALYVKSPSATMDRLRDDLLKAAETVPLDHPDNEYGYEEQVVKPMTFNEGFARNIYYDQDAEKGYKIVKWIILGLLTFFIVLPTLNLINLNVSRIMERSSEIGVRKAFGASRGNIIFQFITENVIQTFIGGILGLGLALLIIKILNQGGYLGEARLTLYPKFFIYSFIATLIFGIISGLIPALKMSSLHIVNALKDRKL